MSSEIAGAGGHPLSVSNLNKTFSTSAGEKLPILRDISLQVADGEHLAITGTSGSGKTTLLSLLAGLDMPDSGEVWLCGQPLHSLPEEARAASRLGRVGFVFQDFQLIPGLTAQENVMLPLELMRRRNAPALATEQLAQLGLQDRLAHYPAQLSGGERQRVALARALVAEPQLLFADEPTGNLDEATSKRLTDLLLSGETAVSIVLVTHDKSLAARCHRTLQLRSGQLQESTD